MDVWIAALAGSSLPLVIVPGGGPFADQVRDAQRRMGFSDTAAHAMAILAMDQFGHVILDRHERLAPARSLEDIEQRVGGRENPGLAAVRRWPFSAPDIPASWDITSDSLAAWLAGKLGADALLLIKQTGRSPEHDGVASLTARGIVDAGFAAMLPADVDLLSPARKMLPRPGRCCRRAGCRERRSRSVGHARREERDSRWRSCIRRAGHGS